MGACEPTRILEGYRLGIIEEPPECATKKPGRDDSFLSQLGAAIPPDSLVMRAVNCIKDAFKYISDHVPAADLSLLATIAAATGPVTLPPGTTAQGVHDAICRLRQAVMDLYFNSSHNTRCQLLHVLDQITCRPPTENEIREPDAYATAMKSAVDDLFGLLIQYALDCICYALIPPCSPDPCEDRLILACVTVKDDKIVDICNFGCRRYAGAFPSLFYWLSVVPIVPIIKALVQKFCCGPGLVHANSPLVNELMDWLNRVDPTGNARSALVAGDFALPKHFAQELVAAAGKVSLTSLTERLLRPDAINLPTFVGRSTENTSRTLKTAGVEVGAVREVESADNSRRLKNLTMNPLVARGDKVVLYQKDDKVVGFGPFDPAEESAKTEEKLRTLTEEMSVLKRRVSALSRTRNR